MEPCGGPTVGLEGEVGRGGGGLEGVVADGGDGCGGGRW